MSARPRPLRIGLTGGIASGKSTVADLFAELGVPIIDTDLIARDVVEPGQPALDEIREAFGPTAIDADVGAWSRATGNAIVERGDHARGRRYVIEKGEPRRSGHALAAIISDDGLFELLSPLGFALAAALDGHDVALYLQGPAVRVLSERFTPKMHGVGRPFSRFPRDGLAK